ncbi:MAG: cytidine deaminase [Clostridia bacterium]|nr:cytidine deaminase [Clostridia bacterium]
MTDYTQLIEKAIEARERSYSPYSNFKVGASLLCNNGKIYTGCNVENSAYSECICAERVALSKAVSEGECEFLAMAVVGGKSEIVDFVYPCGACRQFLSELCPPKMEIILYNGKDTKSEALDGLLPCSFSKSNIK